MNTWRKFAALLAATLLLVGLAACGDDDDDETAVGTDDTEDAASEGDDHDMGDEEGNPCAEGAPDDALPPAEELDADATAVTITATDYEFAGVDALEAGGTFGVTFVNEGTELHEFSFNRLADSETRPLQEIIESGEEPELTDLAFGLACPGDETTFNAEVSEPGRYVAICLVPVGSTPEATEMSEGPPHAAEGMVVEFTIE